MLLRFFPVDGLPYEKAKLIGAPPQAVKESERNAYWDLIKRTQATLDDKNHLMRNPPRREARPEQGSERHQEFDTEIGAAADAIVNVASELDNFEMLDLGAEDI